jgi:hypothetical protein
MPGKGFWTLEDIQAAKSLVREIVTVADLKGTLRPNDADSIVAKARIIYAKVKSNKPVEEITLPL